MLPKIYLMQLLMKCKMFLMGKLLMDPLEPTSSLLCDNNNIGLLLNVDWFKSFKLSAYKVSAIMMTVLNLPRSERF